MSNQKKKIITTADIIPIQRPHHHDHDHSHDHSEGEPNLFLNYVYKVCQEANDIKKAYARLLDQTTHALMKCLELRDGYTYGHSMRVMEYALLIAREQNIQGEDLRNIELAAMFHDIGKIGVRDCVLLKEGPLEEEEDESIRQHPEIGADLLDLIDEFKIISPGVRHHHERVDGKGYPGCLAKDEIPFYSRIILVADTFDAMTSNRPYRKALPIEVAYAELERFSGTQFDPEFVKSFLDAHKKLTGRDSIKKVLPNKKAA